MHLSDAELQMAKKDKLETGNYANEIVDNTSPPKKKLKPPMLSMTWCPYIITQVVGRVLEMLPKEENLNLLKDKTKKDFNI